MERHAHVSADLTPAPLDKLVWWREARFGLFIHWGVYSALEGSWQGRETQGIPEWIQCRERIPLAEYRKFAPDLTLKNFDARAIVALAKSTGMKYIVMTAKHHDGFAMFDSQVSDYNIVKMGPSRRDPCRELAEAAREAGLTMCFYYSQALDWEDPDAAGNDWDFDPAKKDFRRFLDGKCKGQLRELLTNYGPLGLIWCDVPIGITDEQSWELKRYVQSIQSQCLVSGRISHTHGIGDYGSLGDNHLPAGGVVGEWETPGTLNNSWGYKPCDHNWKDSSELIRLLCQLASKGVNYLLNIGPRADGSVPEESVRILNEVGAWMQANGEAIHGTSASPLPTDFAWGRVTVKGDNLYFFVLDERRSLEVAGIRSKVRSVHLLGATAGELVFRELHDSASDRHKLSIDLPAPVNALPRVLRVVLEGAPDVITVPVIQPDGVIELPAYLADLHVAEAVARSGSSASTDIAQEAEAANLATGKGLTIDRSGVIANWFDPGSSISWQCMIDEPGEYRVELRTLAKKYGPWVGGHRVSVECEEASVAGQLDADTHPDTPNARYFFETGSCLGPLSIRRGGRQKITLRAHSLNPEDSAGLAVSNLVLTRA
jgi:alpha-L-fucosidase